MKRILFLPILVLAFSQALHAGRTLNSSIFESSVYVIHPGMDAVLVLTPNQLAKVKAANDAWQNDPGLGATREAFNQSKNSAPAEADAAKGAYYSAQKVARSNYDEAVAGILSGEQKSLVESLNRFSKEVAKDTGSERTWAERMTRLKALGTKRLSEDLTPAQIELLAAFNE